MNMGGVATASASGSRSQSKRERSRSSKIATSPSSTRERADNWAMAAAMWGDRRRVHRGRRRLMAAKPGLVQKLWSPWALGGRFLAIGGRPMTHGTRLGVLMAALALFGAGCATVDWTEDLFAKQRVEVDTRFGKVE